MKKVLLVCLLMLGIATVYAADNSIKITTGLDLGFSSYNWLSSYSSFGDIDTVSYNENNININFFVDLTYLRVDVGYGANVSSPTVASADSATSTTITTTGSGVSDSFFLFSVLAKYPFAVTPNISLWPAIGIEKDFILGETQNDVPATLSNDATDIESPFLLKGGLGLDIVMGQFVITPYVFYGYNLTSQPASDTTSLYSYFSYKIDAGVSIGFRL